MLAREQGFDPVALKGSYAGAMGLPQFISSSYRRFSVDFDGDGNSNLLTNPSDAIGSVGNYLYQHGWIRGQKIAIKARINDEKFKPLLEMGLNPKIHLAQFKSAGVEPETQIPMKSRGALVALETVDGHEYWVGLKNFYVITRYNHSALYAMAVYQLAKAIRSRYNNYEDG